MKNVAQFFFHATILQPSWLSEFCAHVKTYFFFVTSVMQKSGSSRAPLILVINKIDCTPSALELSGMKSNSFSKCVHTCALTGQGILELESAILDIMGLDRMPAAGRRWTVNQVVYLLLWCFSFGFKVWARISGIWLSVKQIPRYNAQRVNIQGVSFPCRIFLWESPCGIFVPCF